MGLFRRKPEPFLSATPEASTYPASPGGPRPATSGVVPSSAPAVPAPSGALFSMPVEDVFTITGRGTVVTGRVATGTLAVGDRVSVVRAGSVLTMTEVTGIEAFRSRRTTASAGDAVGVLLKGVGRDDVQRGDELRGSGA